MTKTTYITPALRILRLAPTGIICGSNLTNVGTNVGIGYGGSSDNDSGDGAWVKGSDGDFWNDAAFSDDE